MTTHDEPNLNGLEILEHEIPDLTRGVHQQELKACWCDVRLTSGFLTVTKTNQRVHFLTAKPE